MENFELLKRITIRNPKINMKETQCFLYNNFINAGIIKKALQQWLDGKILDIYRFNGRFGKSTKCPWCDAKENDLSTHIKIHNKKIEDIETIKLSDKLYRLLLFYLRNGNYDALSFLVMKDCQYCITPKIKGREDKCAIPESSRNKPRSLKMLGFKCDGFKFSDYEKNDVAILYRRMPR